MKIMDNKVKNSATLFPIPALSPDKKAAVYVSSLSVSDETDGVRTMRVSFKRNLSVPLRSFTFRYRFSAVPVYRADSEHPFLSFTYSESDINESESITVTGDIPVGTRFDGCSVYVSEAVLASGQVITVDAAEYAYIRRPAAKALPFDADSDASEAAAKAAHAHSPEPPSRERTIRRRIGLSVICVSALLVLTAEILLFFHLSDYFGVKNSVSVLTADKRYNEAFKIALDSGYSDILQDVCSEAFDYYAAENELETAYVYASCAPTDLRAAAVDYAASLLADERTGKISADAFRIVKMSESDQRFDAAVTDAVSVLELHGNFRSSLLMVSQLRDDGLRSEYTSRVIRDAFVYFSENLMYPEAAAFADSISELPIEAPSVKEIMALAADAFNYTGDRAAALYFADTYRSSSALFDTPTKIKPDDYGIRTDHGRLYALMSADEKRLYHADNAAVGFGGIHIIREGKIDGTDITDAVSVSANENSLLVLHNNGSVTLLFDPAYEKSYVIPEYRDVISAVLGCDHAVLLHENGTVSVHGNNTDSMSEIRNWTDVTAVAAGEGFTVGLRSDGTAAAAGSNVCGQCDVDIYFNVVDIAACSQSTVLLFADGTAVIQGYRSLGLAEMEIQKNVRRMRAGGASVLLEYRDGTFGFFTGQSGGTPCDTSEWQSITDFAVGATAVCCVDENGTAHTYSLIG